MSKSISNSEPLNYRNKLAAEVNISSLENMKKVYRCLDEAEFIFLEATDNWSYLTEMIWQWEYQEAEDADGSGWSLMLEIMMQNEGWPVESP